MAAINSSKARSIGDSVRQVTKSNFAAAIHQIKADIEAADFVAVSTRKTGDSSTASHRRPWRRILPFDTPDTAYFKSKISAESFEILQFAVCPFSISGSKVIAFPYNFHLFPRDELSLGMPSHSFSCQTSFLSSMAREGFDFNACIYDGISYLSRVQEFEARKRNPRPWLNPINSSQSSSAADSIFKERIKSRVTHWWKACKDTSQSKDVSLIQSLRKLILGSEVYGSRPGISIDICSENQVQLVFETVKQISNELVPIYIPGNGGQPMAVRVVLTSSKEDKMVLLTELQGHEDEQNLKLRGFLEIIDLISSSGKTIVSHNSLHDFTFIHQKFLGPLPATLSEFMCSLRFLFSNVIDLNHLLKEIGPLRKAKNIPSALSYIKRQFFVPIELEVPQRDQDGNNHHGKNVLRIASLFTKIMMLLKSCPSGKTEVKDTRPIEDYANTFHTASITLHEPDFYDDAGYLIDTAQRICTNNIIFLWGFCGANSAAELKHHLFQSHPVFFDEFDVHMVDKTCAVVVFKSSDSVVTFLKEINSVETASGVFKEMIVEGLRAAGYEAYIKVCKLGLWEGDLANSFQVSLDDSLEVQCSLSRTNTNEVHWNSEMMINLNDL